jgi:hypothetical protein
MISLRRPKRFVRTPPAAATITAPTRTALTTISSMVAERENCFLMNRMAPGDNARVLTEEQASEGSYPHCGVNKRFPN